jgi:hypothetical protein
MRKQECDTYGVIQNLKSTIRRKSPININALASGTR